MAHIPLFNVEFSEADKKAVCDVLDSGMLSMGKMTQVFEERFAEFVGAKHAIGVNSCTSALFLSYLTLNKGRAIYMPSVTFVSVAAMGVKSGMHVEFTDRIEVGRCYRIGNTEIFDSAHDCSRNCFNRLEMMAHKDRLVCYSFYPTKPLPSCEGGMICTNNDKLAEHLRKARAHGMVRQGYDWDYSVEFSGWKMGMNDIQAALGLSQLNKLEETNALRTAVLNKYRSKIKVLTPPSVHIVGVWVKHRDKAMKALKEKEIGYTVNYKPIHLQPAFKNWHIDNSQLKYSEEWGKHELSLPFYPSMTEKEVDTVCKVIQPYLSAS